MDGIQNRSSVSNNVYSSEGNEARPDGGTVLRANRYLELRRSFIGG